MWRAITTPVNYVCLKKHLDESISYLESDYDARKLRQYQKVSIKGFLIWRAITTPVNYVRLKFWTPKFGMEKQRRAVEIIQVLRGHGAELPRASLGFGTHSWVTCFI